MKWKQEAIEKLRKYNLLLSARVNIPEEIARLESEACSIKSATADGTPVQGGGNKREDRILDNIMAREELQLQYKRNEREIHAIERGIAALNEEERRVLKEMYMTSDKGGKERLMRELNLTDETSLYKKAKRILYRFTLAMYGYMD